jgi:FAD/FMN-containing dehydrogenase
MKGELVKKIQDSIQGDVAFDEKTLKEHAHDASMFEIMPELVVYPKSSADIQSLVKLVSQHKPQFENLSITPRSAGTCMAGGPLTSSISLDVTKYLNHTGEVDTEHKTLVAEPGVYYRDFEEKTLQHNLLYPAYPASKSIAAMGGIVGNNGAGEKTLQYGKAEDYVARLNVVLSDGNEYEFKPLSVEELEEKKSQQSFEGEIYRKMFDLLDAS